MLEKARKRRRAPWRLAPALAAFAAAGCGDSPVIGGDASVEDAPEGSIDAPLMCAGSQTACSGRCVDVTSDPAHCGACGNACTGALACVTGSCQLRCPEGQSACAGRCVALQTDNANCGACGNACPAGQVCAMGRCDVSCGGSLATCEGGGGDGGAADGGGGGRYCADTRVDPRNCGGCGMACALPNVGVNACANGSCIVGGCTAGFADCDGMAANGCETNVRGADANNCGGCGLACRFANAGATCAAGSCALGTCNAGFADCDMNPANGCEANTAGDNANCGMCGRACAAGQVCSMGTCGASCGAGTTNCSGDCVNTRTDPAHCGMCGNACRLANASVNACVAGACVVGGCNAGFADCDGMAANGCETNVRGADANNCGACGVACRFANAGAACSAGSCALGACNAGFANCDTNAANGCETNTAVDNANCGMCGRACAAGQVCASGTCTASCGTGTTNCSGDCVNTRTDPANCGGCGVACRLANVGVNACVSGACVVGGCNAGFGDCDGTASNGCETNVRGADVNNCGGCGVACRFANAGATCSAGSCALGACNAGFANCDTNAANGCETNTAVDNANCGMCGRACAAGQVCASGTCTASCGAGTTNCSGACVNTRTDPANCGGCGTACALPNVSVNACGSGACVVGGCNAGFADCDGTASNGCETNTGTSAGNCGRCGVACGSGESCVGGACVTTSAGGTVFQVAGLSTNACRLIEHASVTGDDRGGIAVSGSQVFYTGDSATGRFSTVDVSGGASTGSGYDALFSNLSTQQVYAFGNAAGPFRGTFGGANVTFDRFFAVNGDTGAAGAATMLSMPITISDTIFSSSTGYFSGAGRVVVAANGRLFDVALPAGTVRDLGAFTFPGHTTCESSAVWGVAEFFGGALYVDYVQSSTVIARTQAFPAGPTTTLATFSSLSDMCSFTVSPATNRWYWHHEGGSQFGGSDESVGFCNMTPAPDFAVPGMSTNGCTTSREHVSVTGDDRGGIAVSSSQVFYSGDGATGRFSAGDLSGGTSTGASYDAMFTDLSTESVYAFGNASAPFRGSFGGGSFTFDRIYRIDGNTGATTGTPILLSTPIAITDTCCSVPTSAGYFSGAGRVLVANGSRLYDVLVPSGVVRDLGAFTQPTHTVCESSGYWGVAEQSGSTLSIVYVQSPSAIVRTQVFPAGATTTVQSFSTLSDMCSIVVSPSRGRWYWHHEGGSQFGGSDESIGYCSLR